VLILLYAGMGDLQAFQVHWAHVAKLVAGRGGLPAKDDYGKDPARRLYLRGILCM
jgi:hypothetical protein